MKRAKKKKGEKSILILKKNFDLDIEKESVREN